MLVLPAALFWAGPAGAQSLVSMDNGSPLARYCYLDALAAVKSAHVAGDAIADCSAALGDAMTPKVRAATFDNRGVLYDVQKNYAAAWDDFNTSITLNGALGDAYLNRGVALIRLQRSDEALADIQRGMQLGASLPQIGYYDLGVAEENLGRLNEAYADFKRSLAADPGFTEASEALKNFTLVEKPPA